jgi:pimeloyl-ACP methyl ester carboxylesterase
VAFGAAALTANVRKLVLYEGWPVPDPSVYALPADVMKRMDQLLAEGDRDGVVEALFRSVEDVSDEDMAALRSAPSWPGRVAAAHTLPREISGETQARLEPAQAAKIGVPVLLVTGEESTDPAKAEVGAVAAALPDARRLMLPGQQHIADILTRRRSRSTCWVPPRAPLTRTRWRCLVRRTHSHAALRALIDRRVNQCPTRP